MKTYKQLSKAQQKAIDSMKEDKDSYCTKSMYYDFQRIVRPNLVEDWETNTFKDTFCKRPTLRILINENILIRKEHINRTTDRYVLNPEFIFDK